MHQTVLNTLVSHQLTMGGASLKQISSPRQHHLLQLPSCLLAFNNRSGSSRRKQTNLCTELINDNCVSDDSCLFCSDNGCVYASPETAFAWQANSFRPDKIQRRVLQSALIWTARWTISLIIAVLTSVLLGTIRSCLLFLPRRVGPLASVYATQT